MSAPAVKFDCLDKGLFVLERTRTVGHMTGAILSVYPQWNRAAASRYLTFLATRGWLERIESSDGIPKYVLGAKALALGADFSL